MDKKFLLVSFLAIAASFVGGFFVANALNRTELESLRAENEKLKAGSIEPPETQDDNSITDDELRAKIAEADRNPGNFDFQKNLGIALYKYAAMKRDDGLLKESARILDRASGQKKDDFDVLVALGNAHFDMGYFGKHSDEFAISREIYIKALAIRATDVEVRTDLGLTYFLADPPDDTLAIAEFQRSLKTDPRHVKTLEFIIQSFIRQKKLAEAETYLATLRSAQPANENLPDLESKITEAKDPQQK